MPILTVSGSLSSPLFHEARLVAEDIVTEDPGLKLRVVGLVEAEWLEYLARAKEELGGRAYDHTTDLPLVSHSVVGYVGATDELVAWADQLYQTGDPRSDRKTYAQLQGQFAAIAEHQLATYVAAKQGQSKFAFLEFTIPASEGSSAPTVHRIVVELFAARCPKTVENFLALCSGERGVAPSGAALHFLNTPMHRVVRDAWLQFGDVVSGRGNGGESIFGPFFPDESLECGHDGPGVLAMASAGSPHTNNSQFYVTLKALPALDGKRVVFGRIVLGMEALTALNAVPLRMERPVQPVLITACGAFAPPAPTDDESPEPDRGALRKNGGSNASQQQQEQQRRGGKRKAAFETTVAVVGPQGAGKTSIVNVLKNEPEASVAPTNGFELDVFPVGARARPVRAFGLGGGAKIKGIWPHYYADVHGVVFVLDARDRGALDTAAADWAALLAHESVTDKPVLVLLNKTDDDDDAKGYITPHEVIVKLKIKVRSIIYYLIMNSSSLLKVTQVYPFFFFFFFFFVCVCV